MKNYYKALGVLNSATDDEIRRAYRILARRYHPDVNPGDKSAERFKEIAEGYDVLSDPKKRELYDITIENVQRRQMNEKLRAYQKEQSKSFQQKAEAREQKGAQPKVEEPSFDRKASKLDLLVEKAISCRLDLKDQYNKIKNKFVKTPKSRQPGNRVSKISIVEVSVAIEDAISGTRRKIEISEPEGTRNVSIVIPAGVRDGSVLRLRDKGETREELVLIVRLASHPFLSIKPKGLVAEIPISVPEAVNGAQITVPGIEDEIVVRIPAGSQSGSEIRIKEKGIVGKGGVRGDYILRLMIRTPESIDAVGLKDKVNEIGKYYEGNIRNTLPKTLLSTK